VRTAGCGTVVSFSYAGGGAARGPSRVHVCDREAVRVCDLVVKSSSGGLGDPTAGPMFGSGIVRSCPFVRDKTCVHYIRQRAVGLQYTLLVLFYVLGIFPTRPCCFLGGYGCIDGGQILSQKKI
jgi:hypothetical protein